MWPRSAALIGSSSSGDDAFGLKLTLLALPILFAIDSLVADVKESIEEELDFSTCIYELTV